MDHYLMAQRTPESVAGAVEEYSRAVAFDPDFAPILEAQQQNQARERDKILSVVCNDNPYADVWAPAEGTCQRK